ncbi:MAG: aminoglycoside phosphotransferase family protein [Nanoarchaeota archaeon]|nr:aminoglycoside phosphotransferase family protein [Nanoarchaeota archaeon]
MKNTKLYLDEISRVYPEVKWKRVKRIDNNGIAYVVIVLDGKLVFRFPKERGEAESSLRTEMDFLDLFAPKVKLKVPRYNYKPKDSSFGGYTFIAGKEAGSFSSLNNLNTRENVCLFADFLSILHTFSKKGLKIKEYDPYPEVARYSEKKLRVISHLLSDKEKKFLKRVISEIRGLKFPKKCIVHSDLRADHVLVKGNKVVGIIDFGDLSVGDPSRDFTFFWNLGGDFVKQVYKKYNGPKDEGLLKRAELLNVNQYITDVYYGIKMRKRRWKFPSLNKIRKIVKEGLIYTAI